MRAFASKTNCEVGRIMKSELICLMNVLREGHSKLSTFRNCLTSLHRDSASIYGIKPLFISLYDSSWVAAVRFAMTAEP